MRGQWYGFNMGSLLFSTLVPISGRDVNGRGQEHVFLSGMNGRYSLIIPCFARNRYLMAIFAPSTTSLGR